MYGELRNRVIITRPATTPANSDTFRDRKTPDPMTAEHEHAEHGGGRKIEPVVDQVAKPERPGAEGEPESKQSQPATPGQMPRGSRERGDIRHHMSVVDHERRSLEAPKTMNSASSFEMDQHPVLVRSTPATFSWPPGIRCEAELRMPNTVIPRVFGLIVESGVSPDDFANDECSEGQPQRKQ